MMQAATELGKLVVDAVVGLPVGGSIAAAGSYWFNSVYPIGCNPNLKVNAFGANCELPSVLGMTVYSADHIVGLGLGSAILVGIGVHVFQSRTHA